MLPALLANETREQILSFLETTFAFRESAVWEALEGFLRDGEEGIFKGPYLNLELPYRKATEEEDAAIPLAVRPGFRPFRHQCEAWQRLSSRENAPRHTLVTTGTSSGKTECFLYPVLDHVARCRGQSGIKAIILYPMNALATDQARRLAEAIHEDETLRGRGRAGMYVGGLGSGEGRTQMSEDELITSRDVLRKSPPDILLTNYKMLDLLLMRPADKGLWQHNGPETLQYLVVDELHTFDGAQGADVACLIRRLRARLRIPDEALTCIGTSATIAGSGAEGPKHLARFASTIFGAAVGEDAVVGETHLSVAEYLERAEEVHHDCPLPEAEACLPLADELHPAYLKRLAQAWFGDVALNGKGELDALALGDRVRGSEFMALLLRRGAGAVRELDLVARALAADLGVGVEETGKLLLGFLALLAEARWSPLPGERPQPLLAKTQVQTWVRELSRLGRVLAVEPGFRWLRDETRDLQTKALPPWFCRECGATGWLSCARAGDSQLQDDRTEIYKTYFDNAKFTVYVTPPRPRTGQQQLVATTVSGDRVCPHCLWFGRQSALGEGTRDRCPSCQTELLALDVCPAQLRSTSSRDYDTKTCPACGEAGHLAIVGSQSASLASIALGHLYTHPLNVQPKLLAFTDSVQDASHRAGFFQARTFRVCLRTAVARVVAAEGPVPLAGLGARVINWWCARLTPQLKAQKAVEYVIAHLTPPDLVELPEYLAALPPKAGEAEHQAMLAVLARRLDWEFAVEFGHQSRRGRTLEKAAAAHAHFPDDAVERLVAGLAEAIAVQFARELPQEKLRIWASGILHEARRAGAIDHPYIHAYAEDGGGNRFLLSKSARTKYAQEHAPYRGEPKLLSDQTHGKGVVPLGVVGHQRATWFLHWCRRVLEENPERPILDDQELHEYGRLFLQGAVKEGLLREYQAKGQARTYALRPEAVLLGTQGELVRCTTCNAHLTVWQASTMENWPCAARGCAGTMQPVGRGEQQRARFYRERYLHGTIRRIVAHEHTGLLDRQERESIEESFKGQGDFEKRADNLNLLTCTSTMEMGINIGDLSSTMLCSVPPTTASYLQRIGRAGRGTGCALILSMATSTSHDLHFFTDPQAMMSGEVRMPGIFLEAPEVLSRHFVAYLFDCLVQDGSVTTANWPRVMNAAQEGWDGGTGPLRGLVERLGAETETWHEAFRNAFPEAAGTAVWPRLAGLITPAAVEQAFQRVMDQYVQEAERIRVRLKVLRAERDALKQVKQPDTKTQERFEDVEHQIKGLVSRRKHLRERNTWATLVDRGVLPNYAFPETGVTLGAQVYFPRHWTRKTENHEWVRPAGQAIRDLAPHNTFYAHCRKFEMQRLELGPEEEALTTWRFCSACHHLAEHAPETTADACPECGAADWCDLGRLRSMHRLQVVASRMSHAASLSGDDADDRQQEFYRIEDFFSIDHTRHESAHAIEKLPFGFELLGEVTLRQVNLGLQGSFGMQAPIAGTDMPEQGYRICVDCGVVDDPRDGKEAKKHPIWCQGRLRAEATAAATRTGGATKKTKGKEEKRAGIVWAGTRHKPERLPYLYRELTSEALRILLPTGALESDEESASFQAALGLGLRLRFGGDPGHLLVRIQRQPLRDGKGSRTYLLIFDEVPGGTGYLREIARPEVLRHILQASLDHLLTCRCRVEITEREEEEEGAEDPNPGGCYRCLLSYQMSHRREFIRRETAIRLLTGILEQWDKLAPCANQSLQDVPETVLAESALESRFYAVLEQAVTGRDGSWRRDVIGGKTGFAFTLGKQSWKVIPQVHLGPVKGVAVDSKPDCLIQPAATRPDQLPVAVFLDGYDPHVHGTDGKSCFGQDLAKRQAIHQSGRYLVWSLSWWDVDGEDLGGGALEGLWDRRAWQAMRRQLGAAFSQGMADLTELMAPGLAQLMAYLEHPRVSDWRRSLARHLISLTMPADLGVPLAEAERCLKGWGKGTHADLPTPGGDSQEAWRFAAYELGEHLRCAVAADHDELMADYVDAEPERLLARLHLLLRLDDRKAHRADRNAFLLPWRRFLALWNFLQFLPNLRVATEEHRLEEEILLRAGVPADAPGPWEPLRQVVSPSVLPLFEALCDEGLPVPEPYHELLDEHGEVAGQALLAWPAEKGGLALLDPGDTEEDIAFQNAGWQVVLADDAGAADAVRAHLKGD